MKWVNHHYIYYCGQESLRRNGVDCIVNKAVLHAVLGCNLKNDRMTSDCFQDKPFNITVIQVCVPTTDCKETAVDRFYENLQHLLELKPKKKKNRCPFHHRGLERKSRKEIPRVTGKFGLQVQNDAEQRLTEFCMLVIQNVAFPTSKR